MHVGDTTTPSARAELNMKEKQRMSKMNDTIEHLRKELEAAGVSSKMNKQSILDNTLHYVTMLQNDVVIAKQKSEYALRMAPAMMESSISPLERYFDMSSVPKCIITTDIALVRANQAFLTMSGFTEGALRHPSTLLACLSVDTSRLRTIVRDAMETRQPVRVAVENGFATSLSMNDLVFTAIFDSSGTAGDCIEVVVVPSSHQYRQRPPTGHITV
ncbi:hypothetical protein DYB37_004685 [Aphanomyces astaci]|uniref:BHLH domain-containing protein n=1 Tax=Aphanomyces astaci TaxID=112090 RepID=A0A397DJX9_APHAT|nr:hypothetical protein AaE_011081 [Aphanomyces astaci]RHY19412.1 hypothetical protein DYB25_001699 [Aphanomyces astaci]RHY36131.1 hypothetical protein DYB38_003548 [Aphanomyces astaci]RHY66642.1 hypothetical protein DYB30_007752 [Aphanomyces astaci]RHY76102.1 hypothetical protein DYB34_001075 [Aphanomyces astaci]